MPVPIMPSLFSSRASSPLEGIGGVKVKFGSVAFTLGLGTGPIQGFRAPEIRVFAGIGWAPYLKSQ